MKRIALILFNISILSLALLKPSLAVTMIAGTSAVIKTDIIYDNRVIRLEKFLKSYNSPLALYANVFIEKADFYNLPDWKLVPAITGVESTFGRAIPYNSYNAYGWCNGDCSFKNWEESIDVVTKALKYKYYDRGADTVPEIARIYAPPSNAWSFKVNYFMHEIDVFLPRKSVELVVSI